MNEIINLRYSKKVNCDSLSTSKTAHINLKITRKESADCRRIQAFKYSKFLPKLQTSKEFDFKSVNIVNDMKGIFQNERHIIYRSQRRQGFNFTKLSTFQDNGQQQIKKYAFVTKQGKRPYNQDRYICKTKNTNIFSKKAILSNKNQYDVFAIFDGHGGSQCAEYLKDNFHIFLSRSKQIDQYPERALRDAFEKSQETFLSSCEAKNIVDTSGSCAVVCLLIGQKVVVANLGDSRAIMFNNESMLELTKDHKPHQIGEKMRIIKHGGKIYKQHQKHYKQLKIFRQMRVLPGNLNVSRTIGDIEVKMKKYGGLPGMISSCPDIVTYDKNNYEILLLGSDGLYEAFTSPQIQSFYNDFCKHHQNIEKQRLLNLFVEQLSQEAETRSSDNITVIAVYLI